MKLGYSILLGEYFEAEAICYTHCKDLQIVCPNCREPIFKRVRSVPEEIHYYAHYEKDKNSIEECELRVNGIKGEQILKQNIESRGQKLKYFMYVFKDMLKEYLDGAPPMSTVYYAIKNMPDQEIDIAMRRITPSFSLKKEYNLIFSKCYNKQEVKEFIEYYWKCYQYALEDRTTLIEELMDSQVKVMGKTKGEVYYNRSIAIDMLKSISTPILYENFRYYLTHIILFHMSLSFYRIRRNIFPDEEQKIYQIFLKIINEKIPNVKDWLNKEVSDEEWRDHFYSITVDLAQILLQLDYLKWLKNNKNEIYSSKRSQATGECNGE